ncbi:hypothetical protein RN001_007264 [Aquatica leii]|uniref:C-type lectin domain-containing protein n=1 Tax=Aquatica leii TaxID=1421715 RepID=A0AAN7SNT4_9COLE|nr:hypothetical protein RN001_007264 [Aquatica leii]
MWHLALFSFVIGVSAQTVSQAGDKCSRQYVCPPEYLKLNQHCYYFSKNKTTWQDAFFACQDLRGKFAIIKHVNQDKMIRSFLNKISIQNEERWIGGMYDWEQMKWKWGASGQEMVFKGFSQMAPEDKEKLQWHCTILDPNLDYKWNARMCLEQKYYICQTKPKFVNKGKKKQHNYPIDKFNKLNEVPLPAHPYHDKDNNFKEYTPNDEAFNITQGVIEDSAFAFRDPSMLERRKDKPKIQKNKRYKKILCETRVVNNETEYYCPQLKYAKRRRRNKSKEDNFASSEKLHTRIYYGSIPNSVLHPRVITEEISFD